MNDQRRRGFHRRTLLGIAIGFGFIGFQLPAPSVQAAENVVLVSGGFRRSIPVVDLDHLARTGEARGVLSTVLAVSGQKPEQVSRLLNESVNLPVTLVSRLLNTRIGEAILKRVAVIIYPLKASSMGVPALRSGIVLATAEGNGSISAIRFLQAYPVRELELSIPALQRLIGKANSISELVRFFSESPLDGLRGDS
ncbi:MAG: alpha/beta hydrolase [Cyanobacteriota bacterium]|nr:alpha/beta hydrolase [Cyanobacteriota bacterium]